MNHIYSLVWNRTLKVLQVASELTRGGHGFSGSDGTSLRPLARTTLAIAMAVALGALAMPVLASSPGGTQPANSSSVTPIHVTPPVHVTPLYKVCDGCYGGGGGGGGGSYDGAGGAGGIGGGLTGTGLSGKGANGAAGANGTQGTGGAGGAGGVPQDVSNAGGYLMPGWTGAGVIGGAGQNGTAGGAGGGVGGGGGGGGGGGAGAVLGGRTSVEGLVSGGAGGVGGTGYSASDGGGGGGGGAGVLLLPNGQLINISNINDGTITGGRGGLGAGGGSNGAGGVGIVAIGDSSIVNPASISGGLSGDGTTRADAVDLSGGGNTLTLENGYSFTGNVVSTSGVGSSATSGGDTLALGGTTNGTFDLAQVGSEFQGFNQFEKTGSSTWTLTGHEGARFDGGITIQTGTLQLGSGSGLVNPSGTALNNDSSLSNNGRLTNDGSVSNNVGASLANSGTLANNGTVSNAGALTSSGVINGTGSFNQTAGTITVDGSLTQSSIAINGGTLAGIDATITSLNTITVASGATLSPGDTAGAVGLLVIAPPIAGQFGNLLDMYGNFNVDVDSVASFDQLHVNGGSVTFGSSSVFNFDLDNDTTQTAGQTFQFFDANEFLNFSDVAFNLSGLASGLTYSVADLGGALQLDLLDVTGGGGGSTGGGGTPVSVPEPGTLGMFGLGLLLLGGGLTRRKQRGTQPRD